RRDVELLERAPRLTYRLGRRLRPECSGGSVAGQVGEAVVVDDLTFGADRDDDEVAEPRPELLEREQDLVALGTALRPLDVLLGLAVGQLAPGERLVCAGPRFGAALGRQGENALRRRGGVEVRVRVDAA